MNIETIQQKKQEIVERYGAWTNHNIKLAEDLYTMSAAPAGADPKLKRLLQIVSDRLHGQSLDRLRVLDLASLEGLYGIELALHGAQVMSLEGREANLAKGRFVKEVLDLKNIEFVQDDVRHLSKEKYGEFDIVLCLGILYHLDAPDVFGFLQRIGEVCTQFAAIDTHVATQPEQQVQWGDRVYWGKSYVEHAPNTSATDKEKSLWASLDNELSFWLTRPSLFDILSQSGFTSIYECHHPAVVRYETLRADGGDRAMFVAVKGQPLPVLASPLANTMQPNVWTEIAHIYLESHGRQNLQAPP